MQEKGRCEKAAKPAPAKSRSLPVPSSPEGGNGNNSGRSPGFRIVPPSPGLPESPTRRGSETLRIQRTSDHDLETTQAVPANRPSIQACPLRRKDGPRSQWRGPRRNRKESPLTDPRASKEAPYLHRLPSFGLPVLLRETPETTARIIGAHGCLSRAQSNAVAAKQRSFEKSWLSGRR